VHLFQLAPLVRVRIIFVELFRLLTLLFRALGTDTHGYRCAVCESSVIENLKQTALEQPRKEQVEAIDEQEKRRIEQDYRTKQQGSIESATKQEFMEAAKTKGR